MQVCASEWLEVVSNIAHGRQDRCHSRHSKDPLFAAPMHRASIVSWPLAHRQLQIDDHRVSLQKMGSQLTFLPFSS
jgi:hypothetical protein